MVTAALVLNEVGAVVFAVVMAMLATIGIVVVVNALRHVVRNRRLR